MSEEEAVWYLAIHGDSQGPMRLSALVRLVQLGAVGGTTYAWRVGLDTWHPLGSFTALNRLLESTRSHPAPVVRAPALRRIAPSVGRCDRLTARGRGRG